MPRIQMTPMVRAALYGLRIYLVVLLALIVLKFVRVFMAPAQARSIVSPPPVERTIREQPSSSAAHK